MSVIYERGCFSYRGAVILNGAEIGSFGPGVDGSVWVTIAGETYTVATDKQAQTLIFEYFQSHPFQQQDD